MRLLKRGYLALVFVFLYAPIAVLIIFSFNESKSRAYWGGFTLKWYAELANDRIILSALYNTLIIALVSAIAATVIGTLAAVGISRMRKTGRKVILNITNIPVLNPDIVTGVSLMILYTFVFKMVGNGSLGFLTLCLSHTAFNVPYVILSVLPKIRQLNPNMYEAALDLGATPIRALFEIILPEIMPGIVTGALLAFTLSVDDFVISFFTTGSNVNTLSIVIFSMARRGINPKINALSAVMFIIVLLLLYLINMRDNGNRSRGKQLGGKNMKKVFILLALIGVALLSGCGEASNKKPEIFVYNWGDYIDEELLSEFEKETGIHVNYETFASNEEVYVKVKSAGSSYDIIIPSDYMIDKMIKEGLVQKIDMKNIPNIKYIDERFMNLEYDPKGEYSVPYMWGTLGIIYNTEMVNEPIDSWDAMWDPQYAGQIFMNIIPRESVGITLKKLGYSINSTDEEQLEEAKQELIRQKSLIQAYVGDNVKDKMIGDEGAMALTFSGDALLCMEENSALDYVVPKEGSNKWFDAIVIPTNAKNISGAEAFINFLCDPEVALKNTEYIGYSTVNSGAYELMSDELKYDPVYWPSDEVLERCEVYLDLGDKAKLLDDLWMEMQAAK